MAVEVSPQAALGSCPPPISTAQRAGESAESVEATLGLDPVIPRRYVRFASSQGESFDGVVIGEIRFTIFIEGRELVTLMWPPWKILTSGCTGGVSFGKFLDDIQRFHVPDDGTLVPPERIYSLLRALYDHADLYRQARGVHTSIFAERGSAEPRFVAEDIGRHNTLDKLQGMALEEGGDTRGGILMASGRI